MLWEFNPEHREGADIKPQLALTSDRAEVPGIAQENSLPGAIAG